MSKVLVRVYSWENQRLYFSDFDIEKGEKVIVTCENSNELGIAEEVDFDTKEETTDKILRIATPRDRETFEKYEKEKENILEVCKDEAKKLELPMKVVDARIGLDGKHIIFVFTADGRVDFRELVKNLSKSLKRSIRMQQIGSRDEARKLGGWGMCGRELCCVKFGGNIPSITTEMARSQQIAHRGAERISGICGRLMCCLAYEAQQYREMMVGMPEIYSVVNTPEGKGTVIEINAPTQEVKVKTEAGEYVVVKKQDLK